MSLRPRLHLAAIPLLLLGIAAETTPAAAQDSFAGFIAGLRDVCAEDPSRACTGRVSAFLDRNKDKKISLQELETLHADAKSAVGDIGSGLSNQERSLISLGVLTLEQAKLETVFRSFDTNADGRLSEAELFADFKLDQRPFGDIISDPDGVDWTAFSARFGKIGNFVLNLLQANQGN